MTGTLRVFVVGGGCAGYQYRMTLVRGPEEGDFAIGHEVVKLMVDPDSAALLEGAQIDYVDDLRRVGFTIYNPQCYEVLRL